MLVIGALCAAAAVVSWLWVSDEKAAAPVPAPPPAPYHGCALPTRDAEVTA